MGKIFIALLKDGNKRFAASMSNGRAKLFYKITHLIELQFLECSSGLQDDNGEDEYLIDAQQFLEFFEEFWQQGWLAEKQGGILYNWAQYAAGMIENITLQPKKWTDRNGDVLEIQRYQQPNI